MDRTTLYKRIKSALHSLRITVKTGDCPTFLKGGEWAEQLVAEIRSYLKQLGMTAVQFGSSEQELARAPRQAAVAWYRGHFAYIRAIDSRTKLFEKDRLKSNLVDCLRREGIPVWEVAGEHIEQILGWHPVPYEDYPRWANS